VSDPYPLFPPVFRPLAGQVLPGAHNTHSFCTHSTEGRGTTRLPSVVVRRAVLEHAEAIDAIYRPIVIETAISFEEEPPNRSEIRRRISRTLPGSWRKTVNASSVTDTQPHFILGRRTDGRRRSRSMSRETPRGIGRQLLARLIDELRNRGYVNALAGIALPNDPSGGLFESHGFERIALRKRVGFKLDRWHDVGWWQVTARRQDSSSGDHCLDR
jgi:L-amino acid N-acyltransferase YncA